MKFKYIKPFLPIIVIIACIVISVLLIATKSKPQRRKPPPATTHVDAIRLELEDYPVIVHTQGTVQPRTESTLIPQVSGQIEWVSPTFREGGFFENGDILLRIEKSDYITALVVAEANLARAQLISAEEEARGEQAREDWKKLGDGSDPGALVLRQPQLADARATVASAISKRDQAQRDLERTEITAPYAGRILEKRVDVGQFVTPGSVMALIYAVDYAEIRLPLSDSEIAFVKLPEIYRGESTQDLESGPKVILRASFGEQLHTWEGYIVRTEGAIDTRSRQLFVVAQVDDPYGRSVANRPPLKAGQFVEAEIMGEVLRDVFVISRSTLREGREVLIIDGDNKLNRREVEIVWSDSENVVVRKQLAPGEVLCLTPLPYAAEGTPVVPNYVGESTPKLKQIMNRGAEITGESKQSEPEPASLQATPENNDPKVVEERETERESST